MNVFKQLGWGFKKRAAKDSQETTLALIVSEEALHATNKKAVEATALANRLFQSRQENHYAQRIRAAYEMEKR